MQALRTAVRLATVSLIAAAWVGTPRPASAHCDTMDGPVVTAARAALDKGDVTPVLAWVKKENEGEIRVAFAKTLSIRKLGPEARDLADMYFFETLVRMHRAGEGAPYTGLEPAGSDIDPAVAMADKALASGSVDELAGEVSSAVAAGIRARHACAVETKKHAGESVEAGREFVAAYVNYVHYVERLHKDAVGSAGHAEPGAASPGGHEHE